MIHFPSRSTSVLPKLLSRAGPLPATHAVDGEPLRRGRIYVAPPDRHLLLDPRRLRVVTGPRENGHRPAVDPMFRSAARAFGPRVIGVILTGSGDDGTAGLLTVKGYEGLAVIQDPQTAFSSGMPSSAAQFVEADYVVPLSQIGPLLSRLTRERSDPNGRLQAGGGEQVRGETEPLAAPDDLLDTEDLVPSPEVSGFTCPDCGGRLWEGVQQGLLRFRCRVGHMYSARSLVDGKNEALETALWAALNVLEENAALANRLAQEAHARNHPLSAARFEEKAEETRGHARLLREVLLSDLTLEARHLNGETGAERAEDPDRDDEDAGPVSAVGREVRRPAIG